MNAVCMEMMESRHRNLNDFESTIGKCTFIQSHWRPTFPPETPSSPFQVYTVSLEKRLYVDALTGRKQNLHTLERESGAVPGVGHFYISYCL